MRLSVRPFLAPAAAAIIASAIACSDQPTQPSNSADRFAGVWTYTNPPYNDPGFPPLNLRLNLTNQNATVTGSATFFLPGESYTMPMSGNVENGILTIEGSGVIRKQPAISVRIVGSLLFHDALVSNIAYDGYRGGLMTFVKEQ